MCLNDKQIKLRICNIFLPISLCIKIFANVHPVLNHIESDVCYRNIYSKREDIVLLNKEL